MKRIKLVLFTGSLATGGTERNVLHIASALPKDIYDVEVWCVYSGQPLQPLIEAAGVRCRTFKKTSVGRNPLSRLLLHNLPFQAKLFREFYRKRPDIVHLFGFPATYYGAILGRLAGVRRIIMSVQDWDVWKSKSPIYRWLDAACSRMSSLIISDGAGAACQAVELQGMQRSKIRVIYDGVNTAELAPSRSRQDTRRDLGLDPESPVVAVIARLDMRKKGQDDVIRAIPLIAAEAPEARMLFVGDGPDAAELKAMADMLPPEQRPIFAGSRGDLADILNAADIVLIPSRWESVPKIMLESMWMGKPVIATRVGDIEEIMDEKSGILIQTDSPEEIAESVIRLLREPALTRCLGEAARARIESMGLTLYKTIDKYDCIYRMIAGD